MKDQSNSIFTQILNDSTYSYVLVACKAPGDKGQMEVEFNYRGDPILASYLLESALFHIQEDGEAFLTSAIHEEETKELESALTLEVR